MTQRISEPGPIERPMPVVNTPVAVPPADRQALPVAERSANSLWALLGLVSAVAVVIAIVATGFAAA